MSLPNAQVGGMLSRYKSPYLIDIIREVGAASDINFCLDAGDKRSYDGSSQTWSDCSGNGNNFLRGTTAGVDATDPTFNGTAGVANDDTYFSFDGGDFFSSTGAHAYADNWHKDNGIVSFAVILYHNTAGATQSIIDSRGNGGTFPGVGLRLGASSDVEFIRQTTVLQTLSAYKPSTGNWCMVFAAYDEPGLTCSLYSGGTGAGTFGGDVNAAVSASTSLNARDPIYIGVSHTTPVDPLAAGSRISAIASWNRKLSTSEVFDIYRTVRHRRHRTLLPPEPLFVA